MESQYIERRPLPREFVENRALKRPILTKYDAMLHVWEDFFTLAKCDGVNIAWWLEESFSDDQLMLLATYRAEIARRGGHG